MKTISIIILFLSTALYADENSALKEMRINTAKEELLIIKKQIVLFKLKNGRYPRTLKDLKIKKKDPWENEYQYKFTGKGFYKYELYSLGPDKVKSKDDIPHDYHNKL